MLVYFVINVVLTLVGYITDQSGVFQAINGMLNIVGLISGVAVGIKRLHDRNRSGWYLLLFYLAPTALVVAGILIGVTMDETTIVSTILGVAAGITGVWAFVEMGCLRGTIGVNQYGPDPVAPATIPPIRTPV